MKRTILAALALVTVVSCSKSDVIEQPDPIAIAFENPFINNSTKATDATLDNLTNFGVYGYVENIGGVIFENELVNKTITNDEMSSSTWRYANTQYWVGGKKYHFSAVAPYYQTSIYTPTAVNAGTISFDNTAANTDLIYAYKSKTTDATLAANNIPVVDFSFQHMLSRIKFSFLNSMVADNATITISDVKITDAYKNGTASVSENTITSWTVENKNNTVNFGGIDAAINKNDTGETTHMYFIPADAATYSLTFTAKLMQGTVEIGTKTHTITIPATKFEASHSYDFKATLTEDNVIDELYPITFKVESTGTWADYGNEIDAPGTTNN